MVLSAKWEPPTPGTREDDDEVHRIMSPNPPPTAADIKRLLSLAPLDEEGGFFVETYRSALRLSATALAAGYDGARDASTAIYYLLTPESFSAMHRVRGDELFHFYMGDPVEMLQVRPGGAHEVTVIGTDLAGGMRPQFVVPAGVWQGLRLVAGGRAALMGATMAPGFDRRDFALGSRAELTALCPARAHLIAALTRDPAPAR
jgi:predicted cupin superfamily sugar epimerase